MSTNVSNRMTYYSKHTPLLLEGSNTSDQTKNEEEYTEPHCDGRRDECVESITELFIMLVFHVNPYSNKYQSCCCRLKVIMTE